MPPDHVLLKGENLTASFRAPGEGLRRQKLRALDNVSISLERGKIHGLVGGSGSGKTTLGRVLVGLIRPSEGRVSFEGASVSDLRGARLRNFRRHVGIIFQNPYRSLNPRMSVGQAIAEPLRLWRVVEPAEVQGELERLLSLVGLKAAYANRAPHQLSGGERQRVAIARALASRPKLLVADEAVSSLDVSTAVEVVNLLMDLRDNSGLTSLFVTHDLAVARVLCDRVSVMSKGAIVEAGTPEQVCDRPEHPYTRELIASQLSVE
jgi:ABC-type glutathione transport system ATPase component